MAAETIKSKPFYQGLHLDHSGKRHLLLLDRHALHWKESPELTGQECWYAANQSTALPMRGSFDGNGRPQIAFRSEAQLLQYLERRLTSETMGLRLYAAGQEDFIWSAFRIAQAAGMTRQEIQLTHEGAISRRVLCVHCNTMHQGATRSIIQCSGCGASLFVRDHFSRYHGAYMGVQVDAELPGDIPPAEALT